ncbi:transposase [Paraburkholderia youngii]
MRGRPKAELVLSETERGQLTALTVAAKLRVTEQIVSNWRARYVTHRLDEPRPGAPRSIEDARVDAVIAKTAESVLAGATRWSTHPMAREMSFWQTAVSRIWRAFGLQSNRQERFILSSDPLFVGSLIRLATSSACTSIRHSKRWCYVLTRRARSRPWIVRSPYCRWRQAFPTICATALPLCLPLWTLPLAKSSVNCTVAIAAVNSCSSCAR